MDCKEFSETVQQAWNLDFHGYPSYRVLKKLKAVKQNLKARCQANLLNSPKAHISSIRPKLNDIKVKLDLSPMDPNFQLLENGFTNEHWLLLEDSQLRQKSRDEWLHLGDKNTKFFHARMKARHARNSLSHLGTATDTCSSDMQQIRAAAPKFIRNLFNQDSYRYIFPKLVVKRKLTQAAIHWLSRPTEEKEIKDTFFLLGADKAPGPSGFNARFYQKN